VAPEISSLDDVPKVIPLAVQLARQKVTRFLGYGAQGRPQRRSQATIEALWPLATKLVAARGSFLIVPRRVAKGLSMPKPSRQVAIGVCTIGPALEQESQRQAALGNLLEALILDAIGSVAAEAAADALNYVICTGARLQGLYPRARLSPGYGAWPLELQPKLLALLPLEQLGVRLTAGGMMVPQKSVSLASNLQSSAAPDPPGRCHRCTMPRCRYRIAAEKS
jgi:hypothetical protein